jgi:hypothetical protein
LGGRSPGAHHLAWHHGTSDTGADPRPGADNHADADSDTDADTDAHADTDTHAHAHADNSSGSRHGIPDIGHDRGANRDHPHHLLRAVPDHDTGDRH